MTLFHITKTEENGFTACYEIEPFLPGYGVTIGHPLQHALLSLPGAAVTALRIAGIEDLSQEIPGVDEGVMDIALNCKQIHIRYDSEKPVTLSLNVRGAGEVTAAALITPEGVEIVNPEKHVATLNHVDACLAMEFLVTRGHGYVPAPTPLRISKGMIQLDAMYTPVLKVSYRVERARVGNAVNYDKLVVTLTTNGTLTPDDAFCLSGDRLARSARALTGEYVQSSTKGVGRERQASVRIPQHIYDRPLNELGLPSRSFNSLKRGGCETAGHILTKSEEELREIRNIGDKSLGEIIEALRVAGCLPSPSEEDGGKR